MAECKKCGKCCTSYPCALHPDDLPKIAEYFNLTMEETISKYLIWDYWIGDMEREYYLCPKRIFDNKEIADWAWAFNERPCIFLDDNKLCKIHEVKPLNGKLEFCKNNEKCSYTKEHARIAWKEHPLNPNNEVDINET